MKGQQKEERDRHNRKEQESRSEMNNIREEIFKLQTDYKATTLKNLRMEVELNEVTQRAEEQMQQIN